MNVPCGEKQLEELIKIALDEDAGAGDLTSEILIPAGLYGTGWIYAKEEGILAGREVASKVFLRVDPDLELDLPIEDGGRIKRGDRVIGVRGRVRSILKGERTALNFLQRMCGIATLTSRYVEQVKGLPVTVVDTRKTTPGLRLLEKYAVRMGGGKNHRLHLADAVLIKDNHLAALREAIGMSLTEIVAKAKANAPPGIVVEVEVTSEAEVREALEGGADMILLDNMSLEEMKRMVAIIGRRARTEASGGIRLENVRRVAESGVDIMSSGALTHSVKALDLSLEIDPASIRLV